MDAALAPIGSFNYRGREYPVWSSFEASYKPEDSVTGKFNRYAKIGKLADEIVERLMEEIEKDPLSEEGRMAYASLLMMQYGIRVGNEDSAEGYESQLPDNLGEFVQTYGVTTLLPEHVKIDNGAMTLDFLGKKQVGQSIKITDPELVKLGEVYLTNPKSHTWLGVDLGKLTYFIKHMFGPNFIPKDLRSFAANTAAFDLMRPYLDKKMTPEEAKATMKNVVEGTAKVLGNTPAVTKSAYLDGRMLDWFVDRIKI